MKRSGVLVALLGVALMLTLLGAWRWADADHGATRPDDAAAQPRVWGGSPGTSHENQVGPAAQKLAPAAQNRAPLVGGVLVSAQDGPLTLGAVELWCGDGRFAARAGVDEDGGFSAPACATTTCVRLRHPAFEQPIAWELAPNEVREFEVSAAPGISGVVRGESGLGVPDASLVVRSDDGRRAAARTDAAGQFAVALPGLRPCDSCDLEGGSPVCREHALNRAGLHARVLVSAPEFAPSEFEVELEIEAETAAVTELLLAPAAAPITGVVRGADQQLFDSRTKVLATNLERPDEQHHAPVEDGQFVLRGLADARYRLRAVRDGRELASLDSVAPGDLVELRAQQAARGIALQLEILDASAQPVGGVRIDGGPFVGAVTDHAGRVEAPDVAPGRYTLRLRALACPVVRAVVDVTPRQVDGIEQTLHLPSSCDAW